MKYIIVNDSKIHVDAKTETYHDHCEHFTTAPPRVEPLRWGVLHWTASGKREGLQGALQVYYSLAKRGLSVHFVITDEGKLWQFADTSQVCSHAGRLNATSIGVEVTGPGHQRGYTGARRVYHDRIHGWAPKAGWIDYTPAQQRTVNALADALASVGAIESRVELQPWSRRDEAYLASHGGWLGHLHCERMNKRHPKCDPGTAPLMALAKHLAVCQMVAAEWIGNARADIKALLADRQVVAMLPPKLLADLEMLVAAETVYRR